jgi:hypothetical protein
MTAGSGLFSTHRSRHPHLTRGNGGLPGEVGDLRLDMYEELGPLTALLVEEYTNPVGTAAPGAAVIKAATATVASIVTLTNPTDFLAAGIAMLAAWPRQIVFTTAGATAADAPANAVITGLDPYGVAQTETVALAQTATTATSTKYWSSVSTIVYPAADGVGATIAIGIAAAVIKAATATVVAKVTLGKTDIIQSDLARHPRSIVFTTAGGTAADAPANAVITGWDINGKPITETVALAQTATTATSNNFFAKIDSIAYPAADGTGATIAITFAAPIGIKKRPKARAGLAASLIREIAVGAVVTNGTLTAPTTSNLPYGSYSPNSAPNDANDYCIYYEQDATLP